MRMLAAAMLRIDHLPFRPDAQLDCDQEPSQPEDIPGEDKHLTSQLRGAVEGALQAFAPVRGIHQHVSDRVYMSVVLEGPGTLRL